MASGDWSLGWQALVDDNASWYPNWCKPQAMRSRPAVPSSFEKVVEELGLSPEEYETSPALKAWV